MQGLRAPIGGWWLKSLSLGGRELLDAPLDLKQSSNDVVVTFSDRATELKGTIAGTPNIRRPTTSSSPSARTRRRGFSTRGASQASRPDAEGRYTIEISRRGNTSSS